MNPTPHRKGPLLEALQNSEARYRRLFETAQDGILILDGSTGQITDANPFLLDMLGYTREQLLGKELWEIGFFKDRALSKEAFEKLHKEGYIRYACLPLKAKDGRGHEVEYVSNVYQVDQQPVIQCNIREITERQRAARELLESRETLQRVINNIPQHVFWKDRNLNYLGANNVFVRSAGLREPAEIIGKSDLDLSWKESAEAYQAVDREVIETGVPKLNFEETQKRPDGSLLWLRTSKLPMVDDAGKNMGMLGIYEDITQHKEAEDALRQSEANLANAQRIAHLGSWEWHILENKLYWSDEACRIVGLSPKTFGATYEGFLKTVHPADRAAVEKAVQESLARKGPYNIEHRLVRPDGSERVVHEQGEVICDETGRPIRMVGTMLDITERKQAEEALRESERRYQTLTEVSPVGIFRTNAQGQTTYVNPRWCQISGLSAAEALDKGWLGAVHPEDREKLAQGWQIAAEAQHASIAEYRFVHPDGTLAWVMGQAVPEKDQAGRIVGYVGTVTDVTKRIQTEARNREQAALLDNANDAIYVTTLDCTILYWNRGAERTYGWTSAEVLNRKTTELISPDAAAAEALAAILMKEESWSGEQRQVTKSGGLVDVFSRLTLVRNERGQPQSVFAINTDITEKKQLETQYLRAQRLENIGALASGIAHDLNNVLAPIIMGAPLLQGMVKDETAHHLLKTMETSARRGAAIVKQVLTFARGVEGERVPLQPQQLLAEMEGLAAETFPKNIRVESDAAADLWPVLGDATQLQQVLLNLCINARDAMPEGGILSLAAENVTIDETTAAQNPGASAGPFVRLRVSDTGTGIPPEVQDRIFEPFFTTKGLGKGTGLGLSTVLGIVKGHGGFIRVDSQVGRGTTFELFIPSASAALPAAMLGSAHPWPRSEGELLLLVDDEAAVREVAREALEESGYRVLICAGGAEAIKLFRASYGEVRLVVTDMMMPEMDGPTLVTALRAIDPKVRIVGITGVTDVATMGRLGALTLSALLAKPFTIGQLLNAAHEALQPAAGAGR